MNARRLLLALACALAPAAGLAQGLYGMASDADGFALPQPDPSFAFPKDHGAHPDFRIEWWYLTANLDGADGQSYGIQWTLFRSALAPEERDGWASPQVWFGHAGVTTADAHLSAETFARGGIGQAGVSVDPFEAWIDDWAMRSLAGPDADALSRLSLTADGADFAYDLTLAADGPLVLQGEGGYSVKSASGQASYYYSQPHYEVSGTLTLPGGAVEVTGQAWLDREWSSQLLSETQTGWDWFSLHFDSGEKLMVYRLRDSAAPDYSAGTLIRPDGTSAYVAPDEITLKPLDLSRVAGRSVPTTWSITWPAHGLDIETRPLNPRAWMYTAFPYWEGPVTVTGSHAGRGYLEMTGYD